MPVALPDSSWRLGYTVEASAATFTACRDSTSCITAATELGPACTPDRVLQESTEAACAPIPTVTLHSTPQQRAGNAHVSEHDDRTSPFRRVRCATPLSGTKPTG